ncbi:F6 protein [Hirschfeldia incana]|nr:F6 protein [Hirschfeldia incana]
MTLLESISNATASQERVDSLSEYPFPLSQDGVFANVKPKVEESPHLGTLINPITGWEISGSDAELIKMGKSFASKLKSKLKDTNRFDKGEFLSMLKQFMEKIGEKVGVEKEEEMKDLVENTELLMGKDVAGLVWGDKACSDVQKMVEKSGVLMGRDVCGLVLKGCVGLEMWELVETLVSNSLVDHSLNGYLVSSLVEKQRSDLLCVVIKQASDLGASELLSILKYFLCPSKEAVSTMVKVREEWDREALLAIEKLSNKEVSKKSRAVAEEACILLMVAHDGFSPSEMCLHYLLASSDVDEVMFSSAVSKLNGNEMRSFIRYLSKWMKKYERLPQAGPCPKAASMLGLKLCDWVPTLEDVTKCLGVIIDENFSTLALHSDLHEELKAIERVADGLASESKLCCFVANVAERLKLGDARN